jgi:hypothetical protein
LRPDKTNPFNPSGTSWNENALAYLQIVERVVARNEIDPIYQTSNQTLTHARLFAFRGIGFAGATSEGEKAFRVVMAEPHDAALQAMEEVFANGGPVAKSYALVAIRALEPARFDALYQAVKYSQEKVPTVQGCIGRDVTLEDMTKDIRSGAYDKSVSGTARKTGF